MLTCVFCSTPLSEGEHFIYIVGIDAHQIQDALDKVRKEKWRDPSAPTIICGPKDMRIDHAYTAPLHCPKCGLLYHKKPEQVEPCKHKNIVETSNNVHCPDCGADESQLAWETTWPGHDK